MKSTSLTIITKSLLWCLLAGTAMKAQKLNKTKLNFPEETKDARIQAILGMDKEAAFVYQAKGENKREKRYVIKYTLPASTKKWVADLPVEEEFLKSATSDISNDGMFFVKGKVILFRSAYQRFAGAIPICATVINKDGKVSPSVKLTSTETSNTSYMGRHYKLSLSPDSNFISIVNAYGGYSSTLIKTSEQVNVTVIRTSDLSLVWNAKLPSTYKGNPTQSNEFRVDNRGSLVFSFFYYIKQWKGQGGMAIGYFQNGDTEINGTDVQLKNGMQIGRSLFLLNGNNTCTVAGFFRDDSERGNKKFSNVGVYYANINYLKNVNVYSKAEYFSANVLAKLDCSASGTERDAIDWRFVNSKLFVCGENTYFIGQNINCSISGIQSRNELIVCKITNEGKLDWMQTVPNRGNDEKDINVFNNGEDKLYFIARAEEKNVSKYIASDYNPKEIIEDDHYTKNGNIISTCISADGNRKTIILDKTTDERLKELYYQGSPKGGVIFFEGLKGPAKAAEIEFD